MSAPANIPSIFDMSNMAALRSAAKRDDPAAIKSAAQQFEALFLQMMLKSMRDATPSDGMFDSEQTRMYEGLLDQQMAQVMAAKGGTGLATVIEKQLTRGSDAVVSYEAGLPMASPAKALPLNGNSRFLPLNGRTPAGAIPLNQAPQRGINFVPVAPSGNADSFSDAAAGSVAANFAAKVGPYAEQTGRTTGIPAQFLVAQAALETGWGRAEPRLADGRPSFNIFGIKAGRGWSGAVAEAVTTEYVDGVAQRSSERFRAYGSYAEAFQDYASLLTSNPRYAALPGTQDATAFARGLQQAGYATDPAYAAKLSRIIAGMPQRTA